MASTKAAALVLGENVAATLDDAGLLHLVIDTGRALRRSRQRIMSGGVVKGGENMLVATTGGNTIIPGTDIRIGINAYRPPKAGE